MYGIVIKPERFRDYLPTSEYICIERKWLRDYPPPQGVDPVLCFLWKKLMKLNKNSFVGALLLLESATTSHLSVTCPAPDPGFFKGGVIPKGGINLLFGQNLPKTVWEWRKLYRGRGGGARVQISLCRSTTDLSSSVFIKTYINEYIADNSLRYNMAKVQNLLLFRLKQHEQIIGFTLNWSCCVEWPCKLRVKHEDVFAGKEPLTLASF